MTVAVVNAFKTFRSLTGETRRQLLILFVTALFFWISITTLLPTLPIYIDSLGGSKQDIGFVMGAFAIGLILSRSWLGNLVDRRSRKLVVLFGTIVAATAPLGYLFFRDLSSLFAVRAYHGLSIAAFTTGYSTLVVDFSPVRQRGEIIGYMSLTAPIGMGIGPALGSYLYESIGYDGLFLVSATSGAIAFLLGFSIQEPDFKKKLAEMKAENPTIERSFWVLCQERAFLVPTLVFLLVGTLFGGLVAFLPLFLLENQLPFSPGLFYSCAAVSGVIGRILSGGASDRYGRGLFITISVFCYGLSMLVLSSARSPSDLILAAILEGTGGGILFPMLLALISDRSGPQERGRAYSICIGGFDVGTALAGPILGVLVISYETMFTLSSGLAVIALFLFFTLSNPTIRHSFLFAFGLEKDLYALRGQVQ
ncbi:MAG: MFS transporter [Microcystis sp. M04BS1]|nr:MFS transporter [Microcystis sp. M04BS1]